MVTQEKSQMAEAVLPTRQGAGVAAALLSAAEEWLRSRGCKRVTLDTTLPLRAAMKFYEKNGYRRSGTVTDFFGMTFVGICERT